MTETEFQLVRGGGFAVALLVAVALQRSAPLSGRTGSWRTNGLLWVLDGIVVGLVCGGCACTAARFAAANGLGLFNVTPTPSWLAIPITIAGLDLVAYAWHRANHHVAFLWRFHRVHHSDLSFTTSTALRIHPGELLLSLPFRLVAITLLGAPVLAIVAFEVAFTTANLIEHGDIRLRAAAERALANVVVTPALHRRHHWSLPAARATNFGTMFTLWDRVLGTYAPNSSAVSVRTGVPEIASDLGPGAVLALPFQRSRGTTAA